MTLDEEALREHCRDQLAGYKVPKRIVAIEDMPRSMLGKILRKQVREQVNARLVIAWPAEGERHEALGGTRPGRIPPGASVLGGTTSWRAVGADSQGHDVVVDAAFGLHQVVVLIQHREEVDRAELDLGLRALALDVDLQVPVVQAAVDELRGAAFASVAQVSGSLAAADHFECVLKRSGSYLPSAFFTSCSPRSPSEATPTS